MDDLWILGRASLFSGDTRVENVVNAVDGANDHAEWSFAPSSTNDLDQEAETSTETGNSTSACG